MTQNFTSDLLTIDEVCELTRWSRATIYSKVCRRQIPYLRLGRSLRFRRRDLLKLFEEIPALRPLHSQDPDDGQNGSER